MNVSPLLDSLCIFLIFFALIRSIIFSLMCLPFFLSSFHLFLSSRVFSPGLCCCGLFYFLLFFFLFFNVVLSLLSSHPFLCWFIMMSIKETCSGEAEVVSPLFFFFFQNTCMRNNKKRKKSV